MLLKSVGAPSVGAALSFVMRRIAVTGSLGSVGAFCTARAAASNARHTNAPSLLSPPTHLYTSPVWIRATSPALEGLTLIVFTSSPAAFRALPAPSKRLGVV